MVNSTIVGLVCCCFLLAVITMFGTYFGNKKIFDDNKGAAAGFWIGCVFFTFVTLIAVFGLFSSGSDTPVYDE